VSQDPREAGPKPPFPEQRQDEPELEGAMTPEPDYGEDSYTGHDRLRDRVALITGGDSGIGRAVALAYAREGADVAISYLEADEDADRTRRIVEAAGRRAITLRGDVGDPQHCRELVERTVSELGRLDVLVNNAAWQSTHDHVSEIPDDAIERAFRTNIMSMFYLVKAAVGHMQPGSAIINSASIQAYQPSPQLLHYSATKGAIVTFTKGLAQQLAEQGIRVNAVAPGPVWTPLIPVSMDEETTAHFGEGDPFGRPAQPAELAGAYDFFLASDGASRVAAECGVTGGKPL
jgi:NAD(P)-dependent dehydrogenase (short-subunit alcohol dehydrogenase family)